MESFAHWLRLNFSFLKIGQKIKKDVMPQGAPEEEQKFETKSELALKLIRRAVEAGTDFDFIAGDGLHDRNAELTRALDHLNLFYVLDVHKDQTVFCQSLRFRFQNVKAIKAEYQQINNRTYNPIQLHKLILWLLL